MLDIYYNGSNVYFENMDITGSCEFTVKIDCVDDKTFTFEIHDLKATHAVGEVELDYILTDAEIEYLENHINDHIDYNLIDDLCDHENYYDEDEWRYE